MITLKGLAGELFEAIRQIPVVDCHEHLMTEEKRNEEKSDVTTLFSHYCNSDLYAAGLDRVQPELDAKDTSAPLEPRWKKFKPFLQAIRYGSYAFPAFAYVRDVLGFDDIDDSTYEAISERLQQDNKPGLYKKVMQDLCGIEVALQCTGLPEKPDQPFFRYLTSDRAIGFGNRSNIDNLEKETDMPIHTLADCVAAIGKNLEKEKAKGAVAMKIGGAYQRSLNFPETPASKADEVFCRLRSSQRSRASDLEMEALENYLVRREIEHCIDLGLVVAIHTGYHAGNLNDIRNSRATHLWSLLRSYPDARFDLFHGSFPYVSDMTVLAKYFENVSLNMCWMHIMGPDISRRALREWLDAVPVTKIFAFGGDYRIVEKVYGHLLLAQSDVAVVLAEKVEEGRFSKDNAMEIARLLFNENPKRWYGLKDA